jgi:hypothetical protein
VAKSKLVLWPNNSGRSNVYARDSGILHTLCGIESGPRHLLFT